MHRRAQPAAGELRPAPCNERINERRLTGSRVTRTYRRPMIGLTLDPARRRRDDERNPTGRFQPDDMLYLIVDKLLPLEVYVRESSGTKRSSFSVHLQVDLIFPMR